MIRLPKIKKRSSEKFVLILIVALAALFGFYGTNWDSGSHLHPDERAIVMYTLPLSLPSSLQNFFSVNSSLNPHFFAYGSFPLYALKAASVLASLHNPLYGTYDAINLLGRDLSVLFFLLTVLLLYTIGMNLFSKKVGLLAALFLTLSVFPLQNAHFYTVDTMLTFFILLTLYQIIRFYNNPNYITAILIGISFGLSLATKVSAIVVFFPLLSVFILDVLILIVRNPNKISLWKGHLTKSIKHLLIMLPISLIFTFLTFITFEPYALIDFNNFWQQTQQQSLMTSTAFIFPYTLQYVNKTPYVYELKNLYLW